MKPLISKILSSSAIASTALVTGLIASPAFAGNLDVPDFVAPPVAAVSDAWGGFYLGGMYAIQSGNWETLENGVSDDNWDPDGGLLGAFAGYNIQRNAIVFGGEIAYSAGDTTFTPELAVNTQTTSDTFIDAKARIGYALDNVLVYGVAGGTWSTSESAGFPAVDMNGFNYGAGAQIKIGGNMIVGIEYLIRDLTGESPLNPAFTFEYVNQTIALRAGWQF